MKLLHQCLYKNINKYRWVLFADQTDMVVKLFTNDFTLER